jgi:hypothetical protein
MVNGIEFILNKRLIGSGCRAIARKSESRLSRTHGLAVFVAGFMKGSRGTELLLDEAERRRGDWAGRRAVAAKALSEAKSMMVGLSNP